MPRLKAFLLLVLLAILPHLQAVEPLASVFYQAHRAIPAITLPRVSLRGDSTFIGVRDDPDGQEFMAGYFVIFETQALAGIYASYDAYGVVLSEGGFSRDLDRGKERP